MPRVAETGVWAVLALLAFASNSILTRMALGEGKMDAASFLTVRLVAGALVLAALVRLRGRATTVPRRRGIAGAVALFVYIAPFSFAYVRIGAAAGALLLFGAVQITMIGWAILSGERPHARTWLGLGLAVVGLALLTFPSVGRPDPLGSALMVVAGCAWGIYSLAGRKAGDALATNAASFGWALPFALVLDVFTLGAAKVTSRGLVLGVASGAIASGLGYAVWYRALRGLTAMQAAILQLTVPIIAALGAVVLLGEALSARLILCGTLVLGGVGLVLAERLRRR